jgi:hypothetical protein
VKTKLIRLQGLLIALVALALSASLAFGAQPDSSATGLANAAAHAGKTVPVANSGDEETAGDEDNDEDTDEDEEAAEEETGDETGDETEETADAADHCLVDPTLLTEDELAAMNHGSVVCWAAHQETWPEEFTNRGAWVSSWAHTGKASETKDAAKAARDAAKAERDAAKDARNAAKGKGNQD